MSQFPKDRRETWITGIGLVSSLGDGLEAIGTLSAAVVSMSIGRHMRRG